MTLFARPLPAELRPQELVIWSGTPAWRTLATGVFHIGAVGLYLCALLLLNAAAARMQHLSAPKAWQGEEPVLIFAALVLGGVALLAWMTARTTRYTLTEQRVILQYGVAVSATLSLPMRMIGAVAVSDGAAGDVIVAMKPGQRIPVIRLWPHLRPWRFRQPQPMLRALPDAAGAAASIARAVQIAQRVNRPADRPVPVEALQAA